MNKAILKEAVLEYRAIGKKLMHQLADKYDYNIYTPEGYELLIAKSSKVVPRKGQLSNRWNFVFHGEHCRFYNKKHRQAVEVALTNPPDFGRIDIWFLMGYLNSTKAYQDLFMPLTEREIKRMLSALYQSGEIEKIV